MCEDVARRVCEEVARQGMYAGSEARGRWVVNCRWLLRRVCVRLRTQYGHGEESVVPE